MANYVYIACSMDGFIARADGGIDWLNDIPNENDDDFGFFEFIARVDCVIMGRNTFETAIGFDFWPYQKPVFVLSDHLKTVPESLRAKAEIISGRPRDVLSRLGERGFSNFYIDGGKTIQGFLKDDLIDEMIITTVSTVLGGGIPLFDGAGVERKFRVTKTEILNPFLVKCHYVRER